MNIDFFTKNLIVLFLLFLLNGCEDVVDVDLDSSAPKIVIDAQISQEGIVKITNTTDFYKPGNYTPIRNAIVSVNDDIGNKYSFHETSPGIYICNNTNIDKPGHKYFMKIVAEKTEYKAISQMPNYVILDSLSLEKAPSKPHEEGLGNYFIHTYFQDEPGVKNYCRFKLYRNGFPLTGFTLYRDKLMDGNYIDFKILVDTEISKIKLGDIITVELMSIDEAAYYFYKTATSVNASASSGRPTTGTVAPANPVTNWNNDALGVFVAYTATKKKIKIVR